MKHTHTHTYECVTIAGALSSINGAARLINEVCVCVCSINGAARLINEVFDNNRNYLSNQSYKENIKDELKYTHTHTHTNMYIYISYE